MGAAPPANLRATGDRIERLVDELQTAADEGTWARVEELLSSVTELYGAGLARIIALVAEHDSRLLDVLAGDELVASLLVVHELHPEGFASRVEEALARVRPLLAAHGGDVTLVEVDPESAAVRLRLLGSCDGCPSSSVTLQTAVERAILDAAPEVRSLTVDEPAPPGAIPVALGPKPAYADCPAEQAVR